MVTPLLSTVTSLASVVGGSPSTGTVTLSGPAPTGGVVVTLTSSDTTLVTVPLSVTVAAGGKSASFPVGSKVVNKKTWVTISATYQMSVVKNRLRLLP